jgi:hypothetical protein
VSAEREGFLWLCLSPLPVPTIKYGTDPANMDINWRLLMGYVIFGVGWSIGGLRPGPSIVQLGTSRPNVQVYISYLLLGMAVKELLFN